MKKLAPYALTSIVSVALGVGIGFTLSAPQVDPPPQLPIAPLPIQPEPAPAQPPAPLIQFPGFPDPSTVDCSGLSQADCSYPCEWGPSCDVCLDIGCQPPGASSGGIPDLTWTPDPIP